MTEIYTEKQKTVKSYNDAICVKRWRRRCAAVEQNSPVKARLHLSISCATHRPRGRVHHRPVQLRLHHVAAERLSSRTKQLVVEEWETGWFYETQKHRRLQQVCWMPHESSSKPHRTVADVPRRLMHIYTNRVLTYFETMQDFSCEACACNGYRCVIQFYLPNPSNRFNFSPCNLCTVS